MTTFTLEGSVEMVSLRAPRVFVVGFSGRDSDAVQKHVDELASAGIPAPPSVPHVWEFGADLLSQTGVIEARTDVTSGEAEPVLILTKDGVFVTVGSDHTDRDLERSSLEDAKRACKKVVASSCWSLDEVRPRWDELELESQARLNSRWVQYQKATLKELLPLDWFLDRFGESREAVVFCGTVATVEGMDTSATGFEAALTDPHSGRQIRCAYRINPISAHA